MIKKTTVVPLAALLLVLAVTISAPPAVQADEYATTIEMFRSSPVVEKFFNDAYGYAVFPSIGKGGFVVGGAFGRGQVYRGGQLTGTATVIEGSIGFQAGGQVFSEIIFFQDERAYQRFTSGSFEFDATAQAVAITAGAVAQAGTAGSSAGVSTGPRTGVQAEAIYINGVATFVHAQGGLMYEFSVGGQKFTFQPL